MLDYGQGNHAVPKVLDYTNKVVNGVLVLRRDADDRRYWICQCPLCQEEFRARTDVVTNATIKRCSKHTAAFHKREAAKAERARVRQGLNVEKSSAADDAEYGIAVNYDSKRTRERNDAKLRQYKGRDERNEAFTRQIFPDSMLRAVERIEDQNGHQRWIFQCACGGKVTALRSNVVSGRTRSCGCAPRGRPAHKVTGHKTTSSPQAFLDLLK